MKIKLNIVLRIALTVLLILVQIGIFAFLLVRFVNWAPIITVSMYVFSLLILLYIVQRDDEAGYKIGWIIVVLLLMPAGGLLYLLFGTKLPTKKLHDALGREHEANSRLLVQSPAVYDELEAKYGRRAGLVTYLRNIASAPVYQNTVTRYYPFGQDMYVDMLAELKKAKHFIFMEYFIIQAGQMWDGILKILVEKAKAGVDVRLLYDDAGSLALLPRNFARQMERAGIKCIPFNPVVPFLALRMNNRDHRKIMVIDGNTAFNGGINLADEYINATHKLGMWKDTGLMLKGDAVWSFTLMFLGTWNAVSKDQIPQRLLDKYRPAACAGGQDGFAQPFGDSPLDENAIGEDAYIDILNQAKDYVYIFTPYLIISEKMKAALALAAGRGVDVRITTPGVPDKKIVYAQTRSHYGALLTAGVRIFEYGPGFLHAKSFVSDDLIAVVGTINLDYRSLYLHFECGTLLIGTGTVMELKADNMRTMDESREILLKDCKRGFFGSVADAVVRIFAPLM